MKKRSQQSIREGGELFNMSEKIKLLIIGGVTALLIGLFLFWIIPAFGTGHHNVWQTTYGEWSDCTPNEGNECGENGGTKTRTVSKVCVSTESDGDDECKIDKDWVSAVYDCELTQNIHGISHDVSEFYNKPTGDDNHCHRITWGNLTVGQQNIFKGWHGNDEDFSFPNHGNWTSAYNNHISENPTAHIVSEGYWEYTPETEETTEEEACEIPEEQVIACEEPKDYCDTLEGVQAEGEDCPEVTPTPTEELTPTEEPRCTGECGSAPTFQGSTTEAPKPDTCTIRFDAPNIVSYSKLNGGRTINWWKSEDTGIEKQAIVYGYALDKLVYGVDNLDKNVESFTINGTDLSKTLWVQVWSYKGDCAEISNTFDP